MDRAISHDPVRGVRVTMRTEPDGSVLFVHTQDTITDILSVARREANEARPGQFIGHTQTVGAKVAELPAVIMMQLKAAGIWGDEAAMKRWLSDPDNRAFRTDSGRRLA